MKHIFFIRHAKSSWKEFGVSDHDRKLNSRGRRDSPLMAQFLRGQDIGLEFILSSTAVRAEGTARAFQEAFNIQEDNFWKDPDLYHSMPEQIILCMTQIPEEHTKVAVFCHNPGLTILADYLSPGHIDNLPTCGIVYTTTNVRYDQLSLDDLSFKDLWAPKLVLDNDV